MTKRSISGYLIKNSYLKSNYNRIENCDQFFNSFSENLFISEEEYIKLRLIKSGNDSQTYLVYHIEREELFVLKIYTSEAGMVNVER